MCEQVPLTSLVSLREIKGGSHTGRCRPCCACIFAGDSRAALRHVTIHASSCLQQAGSSSCQSYPNKVRHNPVTPRTGDRTGWQVRSMFLWVGSFHPFGNGLGVLQNIEKRANAHLKKCVDTLWEVRDKIKKSENSLENTRRTHTFICLGTRGNFQMRFNQFVEATQSLFCFLGPESINSFPNEKMITC